MNRNTKAVLLEKAAKLFVKHGYEKTTTRMLAKAAGVQGPAIYHHFKSKKEILQQIDEDGWQRFQETVFDQVKAAADPEEKIRRYIRHMIAYQFMQGEKNLMVDSNEARKVCRNRKQRDREVFDFFRKTLEELAKTRNVAVNSTVAAFSLFSLVTSVYRWYNPRGAVGPDELADQVTGLFLNGFFGSGKPEAPRGSAKGEKMPAGDREASFGE